MRGGPRARMLDWDVPPPVLPGRWDEVRGRREGREGGQRQGRRRRRRRRDFSSDVAGDIVNIDERTIGKSLLILCVVRGCYLEAILDFFLQLG